MYGKAIIVHSDLQALDAIFKKPLVKAPMAKHLQRIICGLQCYSIQVVYRKGSPLVLANILSRAPLNIANDTSPTNFDLIHLTSATAKAMQLATKTDPSWQQLAEMVTTGWPLSEGSFPDFLTPYWSVRDQRSIVADIIPWSASCCSANPVVINVEEDSCMGASSNCRML